MTLRSWVRASISAVASVDPWDPVVTSPRPTVEIGLGETDRRLEEQLACYVSGQGRVEVQWLEPGRRFSVRPERPLGPGRQRVNCTAPGPDGRYRWFSHPWIVRSATRPGEPTPPTP